MLANQKTGIYTRAEKYAIRKFGPRGVCLLLLGVMWEVLGIAFASNPMERFSKPGSGGVGILDFLDRGPGVFLFSSMWIVGGGTALLTAFQRPITCKDDLGFNGVCLPPFLWGAGYWWSWIVNVFSHGAYGRPSAYFAGLLYWTFTLLIVFLSRYLTDHPDGPCAQRRVVNVRVPR